MTSRRNDSVTDETKTSPNTPGLLPERVLVYWDKGSASIELPPLGSLTIGRSRSCEIRIDHPSVSRRHAILHVEGSIEVEDLGSSNGTRISGKLIGSKRRAPLRRGELVEIGMASLIVQGSAELVSTPTHRDALRDLPDDLTMNRLHRLVDMVSDSRISIVIQGETGSGKEVMAEGIHARSPRRSRAFVRLHCAAIPETLLESELFGFERGAFTGASQMKQGLIETADGGTLFLDEVGEIPLSVQAKLLRVLEAREVSRLGALKPIGVDVRVLAATNRDLEACVLAGTFRRDLYYRLNGITITVPPLRDRTSEIPDLARTFLEEASAAIGTRPGKISPEALKVLQLHDWPGNIRELKNVVERAAVLARGGTILREHVSLSRPSAPPPRIPTSARDSQPPEDLRGELEALERRRILDALDVSGGNQTRAAKLLNMPRRTLLARLDAYGVPRPRKNGFDPV